MSIHIIWTCDQCGLDETEELDSSQMGHDLWPSGRIRRLFDRILCETCHEKAWKEWLAANPGAVLVG